MFGRALEVQLVKKPRKVTDSEHCEVQIDPEVINTIIKDQIKNLAVAAVKVAVAVVVLDTTRKIALKMTPTR